MPDVWLLGAEFVSRFGAARELYALVFDFALALPGFGNMLRRLGAVPASMANAERAIDLGAGVLVYPGGDWDAYRPWTDRHRIDLHGRTGFVRLALRRGVPVFPAVSHGSHDSMIVISRGNHLARIVGMDRMRASVLPLVVGGPLGLTVFGPYAPLPTKIIIEVLEPLDWSIHGSEGADDPDVVATCYEETTSCMQQALDRLVSEVPHPLWARLRTAAGWRPGS
jgi:1-acyl-sn-glycerol-3-phosphate acyltransferase